MNIEHDDHDGYNRVAKTIYGENNTRRWADRCRCGGTRADHVIVDPANLDRPTTAHVSNHNGKESTCAQFVPATNLLFPSVRAVRETPEGAVFVERGGQK